MIHDVYNLMRYNSCHATVELRSTVRRFQAGAGTALIVRAARAWLSMDIPVWEQMRNRPYTIIMLLTLCCVCSLVNANETVSEFKHIIPAHSYQPKVSLEGKGIITSKK
jgi:hypothetical protein